MRRTLLTLMLSLLVCVGWGQTYHYRYWIDNNVGGAVNGSASGEGQFYVNLATVEKGLHALHVQARNTAGLWSSVHTRYFLKDESVVCASARYWIDNDLSTVHNDVATNGTIDTDVTKLGLGLHAVHYQTIGTDGTPSVVHTRYFLKEESVACASARYWIDDDLTTMHSDVATSGIIDIDISKLGMGLHAVHYQTIGTDGTPSTVQTRYFLVDRLQKGSLAVNISIDGGESANYAVSDENIVIDITELAEGEHTLHVTLLDANGCKLEELQQTFVKANSLTGDVNSDGSVDIGDIVMVISVMTGTETDAATIARADVNNDGAADIGDIVSIIDIMTALPASAKARALRYIKQQFSLGDEDSFINDED